MPHSTHQNEPFTDEETEAQMGSFGQCSSVSESLELSAEASDYLPSALSLAIHIASYEV